MAGSSPKRRLRSATATVRLHRPWCGCPGTAARLAPGGASSAGPASRGPRPRRAAGAPCCGRCRRRRGGCSAPGRRAGCLRASGMPMSSAMTRSPPPGAHAPTQSALSRLPPRVPASPAPPKQVHPSPGPGVELLGRVHVLGLDLGDDDVVDHGGVVAGRSARHSRAGRWRARGRRGSTGSRRCRSPPEPWACRGRAAAGSEPFADAQRDVLDGRPRPGALEVAARGLAGVGGAQAGRQVGIRPAPGEEPGRGGRGDRDAASHLLSVDGSGGGRGELAAGAVDVRTRVSRTVVGMPCARSRSTNCCSTPRRDAVHFDPGVGLSGMGLTCTHPRPRATSFRRAGRRATPGR